MAIQPETIETTARIINALLFIALYFVIGFGPGFIIGMLLANRLVGHDKPMRFEGHQENIKKAIEHNKQWDPKLEKWQKE